MIRDDNFLLERFQDSWIHGVFVDCLDRDCPTGNRCADSMIHTDFFAVRPNAISLSAVRETKQNNAEVMITEVFSSIVEDGADAWVPGAGPQRGFCRVVGKIVSGDPYSRFRGCASSLFVLVWLTIRSNDNSNNNARLSCVSYSFLRSID